jgi:hypothetical protein
MMQAPSITPSGDTKNESPLIRPVARSGGTTGTRWHWVCILGLAVLPLLLALGFYYRPFLQDGFANLPVGGDHDFYIYQTARMGEIGWRWWKLGDDPLVGRPYHTFVDIHPGLYEGVELLLLSALTSQFLDPIVNYHLLILLVLTINGSIAAWMVRRLTGSYAWAALAVVLITLNMSTNARIVGHLTLLKYGYVLWVVWAFFRYLDAPSPWRGVLLGLAAGFLLQSSFYLAFLLMLSLGIWWVGCLVSRQLTRKHFGATAAALVVCILLGAALTFPVWTISRETPGSEDFFRRAQVHLWKYSSELWQYVLSPRWEYATTLLKSARLETSDGLTVLNEGWNYPGLIMLLAIALYVATRLGGQPLCRSDPRFVDRMMGLSAVLVILSLAGGPSVLIYEVVPFFRCYGRAGLLAVVLWSVAAPVILYSLVQILRSQALRAALLVAVLTLALYEGDHYRSMLSVFRRQGPEPSWAVWLARQPSDVRMVVLPLEDKPKMSLHIYYYHYLRALHKHAQLNGCDPDLLQDDLLATGSSINAMNPQGLHFLASLGYNTLAIEGGYLQANPWISTLPWLAEVERLDTYVIYRMKPDPELPAPESTQPQRLVRIPLLPIALNQMTWKDGTAEGNGDDPWMVFALGAAQYVKEIRLTYSYGTAENHRANFKVYWKRSDRNDFVEEARNVRLNLKIDSEQKTLTIPVNDTIDYFRIDPDHRKPSVFKIADIVLVLNDSK